MGNRILFLVPSLVLAGAERVVLDLADKLVDEGHQVGIISLADEVPFFSCARNREKIKIYKCGNQSFKFPWFSIKRWSNVKKAIKNFKPQIVHSHLWSFHCIYLSAFLLRNDKISFYHTVHIADSHYTNKKFLYKIFTLIEILAVKYYKATVISISNQVFDLCKNKLKFENVVKISNGIDTTKFFPRKKNLELAKQIKIPDGSKVLINIGRFDTQKGQIYLIEALKILNSWGHSNYILLLIGKDIKVHLEEKVLEYNLQKSVRFLGVSDQVQELIALADLGVFPSLYEGFGLVCGEMMCCELPTIVSDIPPLIEITDNGEGAIVVPVGDSLSLALAIKNLIGDEGLKSKIAKKGRDIILEKFSLECQIRKHLEVYDG
jgi:glycosyltransferase involved in cell wall biosynthesis